MTLLPISDVLRREGALRFTDAQNQGVFPQEIRQGKAVFGALQIETRAKNELVKLQTSLSMMENAARAALKTERKRYGRTM